MRKEILLTKEGYEEFSSLLNYLRKEKRPKVIEELTYAAELGDLRENSEYDAVLHDQAITESKITSLEYILEHAKIIVDIPTDKVGLGSKVQVLIEGEPEEYTIVSSYEADVHKNKISEESVIGSSLLNKCIGDSITVANNGAVYTVLITNIS